MKKLERSRVTPHPMPSGMRKSRAIVGHDYEVEVRIDWDEMRRLAQRAIGNKTGRSKVGPVTIVAIPDPSKP